MNVYRPTGYMSIEQHSQGPSRLFGEMRQALHGAASEVSFSVVLDTFEHAEQQLGVDASRSWLSYADSLLEKWPDAARRVQGSTTKNWLKTGPPHWVQLVRSMGIRNTFIQRTPFERLMSAPDVQKLTALDFKMCRFQAGSLEALALHGNLPELRTLELGVLIELTDREVISLASSTLYRQLEALRLSFGREANPTHIRELVSSHNLKYLKVLRPGGYNMGTVSAYAVSDASHMTELVELDLMGNDLGEEGASALASAQHLSKLRVLMLARNYIGPNGAIAICESEQFEGIELLDLRENFIGARGARALARSPMKNLRVLDLQKNAIGDDGARALAQSPNLSSLAVLELGENGITAAGARALATSPYLPEPLRASWRNR